MSRMTSGRGTSLARALAALFACLACVGTGSAAWAAESTWPTAQAVAAHAEWVPYLDPPAKPAAICLVDSGIDVTPDTPPDSPAGPIVERTSLDGGPGTDVDPNHHGTYMAMTAGAPANDWGTIGFWPGVRIVSVRAMPVGATSFPFDDYRRAIDECRIRAPGDHVAAVNLSLDCSCEPTSGENERFEDTVVVAHHANVNVVASAGNSASAVGAPANEPGVFAVGAAQTATGALCSFSNRGGLSLSAPGCGLDGAWPATGQPFINWAGGTSAAAAQVSATIALLRSYRPDLEWDAVEDLVRRVSTSSEGPALNIEATFHGAGLQGLVDRAKAREATTNPGDATPPTGPLQRSAGPTSGDDTARLRIEVTARRATVVPRVSQLHRTARRLTLRVLNRPTRAWLDVTVQVGAGTEFGYATVAHAARRADTIALALRRFHRQLRLRVRFVADGHKHTYSSPLYRWLAG
jgi:hypothetical protein